MVEVDDTVAVVGGYGVVEHQASDPPPVAEGAPLAELRASRRAVVGNLDMKGQRPFRHRIALVEDLRHDLIPEVERVALDTRLINGDEQPHERGRSSGGARPLVQLRDLI